jgi:hypothetical protein
MIFKMVAAQSALLWRHIEVFGRSFFQKSIGQRVFAICLFAWILHFATQNDQPSASERRVWMFGHLI